MQSNSIFFWWPEKTLILNMGTGSCRFHLTFSKILTPYLDPKNETLEKFDLEIVNRKSFINWKQIILRNICKVYEHWLNSVPWYLLKFTTIQNFLSLFSLQKSINPQAYKQQTHKTLNRFLIWNLQTARIIAICNLEKVFNFMLYVHGLFTHKINI